LHFGQHFKFGGGRLGAHETAAVASRQVINIQL
jgi:hypothetical protein